MAALGGIRAVWESTDGLRNLHAIFDTWQRTAPFADDRLGTQQAFGGGVRKEPRGGAAFPHRRALFYSEPGAGWGTRGKPHSGDALTSTAQAWVAEFSQALRPYVNGAYVNVPNPGMADWETAYWGDHVARLREVKARYDPHNVFNRNQNVPPAKA